jgi:tRNA 2-(methylsulfanyl)-N6-isopentenyladenosine37 hydroxylase
MHLKVSTSPKWVATVLADFDSFLLDHAACERKASATALNFVAHYPDRKELVAAMIDLAREELEHFALVHQRIAERGLILASDTKDPYVGHLAREYRDGSGPYFLDRLLVAGIVEARGCERFGLIAAALEQGPLKDFYRGIARSEVRHKDVFLNLARVYFRAPEIEARLADLLEIEARVVNELPLRAAVH